MAPRRKCGRKPKAKVLPIPMTMHGSPKPRRKYQRKVIPTCPTVQVSSANSDLYPTDLVLRSGRIIKKPLPTIVTLARLSIFDKRTRAYKQRERFCKNDATDAPKAIMGDQQDGGDVPAAEAPVIKKKAPVIRKRKRRELQPEPSPSSASAPGTNNDKTDEEIALELAIASSAYYNLRNRCVKKELFQRRTRQRKGPAAKLLMIPPPTQTQDQRHDTELMPGSPLSPSKAERNDSAGKIEPDEWYSCDLDKGAESTGTNIEWKDEPSTNIRTPFKTSPSVPPSPKAEPSLFPTPDPDVLESKCETESPQREEGEISSHDEDEDDVEPSRGQSGHAHVKLDIWTKSPPVPLLSPNLNRVFYMEGNEMQCLDYGWSPPGSERKSSSCSPRSDAETTEDEPSFLLTPENYPRRKDGLEPEHAVEAQPW